jgi:hypothetical protein
LIDYESLGIALLLILITAMTGSVIAWIFRGGERKKAVTELAEHVEERRKLMAEAQKRDIIKEIEIMLEKHEAKCELRDHDLKSENELRDVTIENNKQSFERFRRYDYLEFKKNLLSYLKNQKFNQEILQTVAFGDTAHSTPYWMFGLDKPPGEDDKPGEGVFYIQNDESRKLQKLDNEERISLDKSRKKSEGSGA